MFELPSQRRVFNQRTAVSLCLGSSLAYSDEQTVKDALSNRNWSCQFFNVQKSLIDVQAFIGECETHSVLCFRGTEPTSVIDWVKNLKMWRTHFIGGKAHAGFQDEWEAVRPLIEKRLPWDKPLLVTGHSKGGAIATLAAYQLRLSTADVAGVYTFGSPRVLDYSAAKGYQSWLGQNTFRCFHSNDPVPRTPWAIRFKHVGTPVYVKESRGWKVKPHPLELLWYQWTSYTGDALEDHDLNGYRKSLINGKDT